MYKKFTYKQLTNIQTDFFQHVKDIYKKQGYPYLKTFLRKSFSNGDTTYFFKSQKPIFKIHKNSKTSYEFYDEREKIHITLQEKSLNKLHNLLKYGKKIDKINDKNPDMLNKLLKEFCNNQDLQTINGKPFLVYDIETPPIMGDNLENAKFVLAYSFLSNDNHQENFKYKYVSDLKLEKFVNFMLDFDGRIIGYNHMAFDNPVCAYNLDYGQDTIEKLNDKSLDLFMFLWNLTGRRLGLDKVSKSLVSLGKTLSISDEGADKIKQYIQTEDRKHLKSVKKYCKNDVKMTLAVLIYMLKYKQIYINNKKYNYDIERFVELANKSKDKDQNKNKKEMQSIF